MKKVSILFAALVLSLSSFAQLQGLFGNNQVAIDSSQNPQDAYGYSWKYDTQMYNWIDIEQPQNEVTGMNDDNFLGPFNIGFDFPFYWLKHNKIYVGSNGYLSFRGFNIAAGSSGFPKFPLKDGFEEVIAGMMTDLNFAGTGNTGKLYVKSDAAAKLFVVSFVKVPFYRNTASGFGGSNTFQFILNGADSTITIQWKEQTGSWDTSLNNSPNPVITGIENVTQQIGICVQALSGRPKARPKANDCIRFYQPKTQIYQAVDAGVGAIQNKNSAGFFVINNALSLINTSVANYGNQPITAPVVVTSTLQDLGGNTAGQSVDTVKNIAVNQSKTFVCSQPFSPLITPVGDPAATFVLSVETQMQGDAYNGNDSRAVEVVALDTTGGHVKMTYCSRDIQGGPFRATGSWNSPNSGMGIFIEPMGYPATVDTIAAVIGRRDTTVQFVVGNPIFKVQIWSANANKERDTLITEETLIADQSISFDGPWWQVPLTNPAVISANGFFVSWIQVDTNAFLFGELTAPISQQSYEILSGFWAPSRENDSIDLWIRAHVNVRQANPCSRLQGSVVATPAYNGGNDGTATIVMTGGEFPFTYAWSPSGGNGATATGLTAGTYTCTVTDFNQCAKTFTVTVDAAVGIEQQAGISKLNVYPNPVTDRLMLDLELDTRSDVMIRIYDLAGNKVRTFFAQGASAVTEKFDLSNVAPGIYFVEIATATGRATRKIVVE